MHALRMHASASHYLININKNSFRMSERTNAEYVFVCPSHDKMPFVIKCLIKTMYDHYYLFPFYSHIRRLFYNRKLARSTHNNKCIQSIGGFVLYNENGKYIRNQIIKMIPVFVFVIIHGNR